MSRFLPLAIVLSALPAACSASPSGARLTSSPAPASCDALQASAAREVETVIGANVSCTTDADCVSVGVGASCFDHCSRAMNIAGTHELTAATQRVDAAQCREFNERGCTFAAPPCMALPTPRCHEGTCR